MPDAPPDRRPGDLLVLGVRGIGEVAAGDDLAALLAGALGDGGLIDGGLADGDILVVSSKIVSKAEGRARRAEAGDGVAADVGSERADDPRQGAIRDQTVRVVAERITPRGLTQIVQSRSGPVLAAAGVDASNVEPGTVLLLPADPDASARELRAALRERTGRRVAVIVSDTAGRAWRDGQTDLAIGCAGVAALEDLRGAVDGHGNTLEVTVRALADQLAAAADLVKGKLDGVPAALVRGLAALVTDEDGPGAAVLLRDAGSDWFRYGHVEAVRAALGVPPGTGAVPPAPVVPGDAAARLERAAAVTRAAGGWTGAAVRVAVVPGPLAAATATVTATPPTTPTTGSAGPAGPAGPAPEAPALIGLGSAVERLLAAAWAEDLDVTVRHLAAGPPATALLTAEVRPTRRLV